MRSVKFKFSKDSTSSITVEAKGLLSEERISAAFFKVVNFSRVSLRFFRSSLVSLASFSNLEMCLLNFSIKRLLCFSLAGIFLLFSSIKSLKSKSPMSILTFLKISIALSIFLSNCLFTSWFLMSSLS